MNMQTICIASYYSKNQTVIGPAAVVAPVLQPGDGGPQYAVDVAEDPHGGVKGEPGGVERDPR